MAASNPLEEILNSEVDESAISAVVGTLESSLLSPTIKASAQLNSDRSNHSADAPKSNAHLVTQKDTRNAMQHAKAALTTGSTMSTDASNKSNAHLSNHNGTPPPLGSTNVGTIVVTRTSTPGDSSNARVVQQNAAAVDQKPPAASATPDVKPVILPGQPPTVSATVTVKNEPDVKPVVYNVVRPSTPQNTVMKQEVKYVARTPSVVNAVNATGGLKTSTVTPASTSVVTLTRPISTPQTVTVVRQPLAAGSTSAPSSGPIQIVSMANSVMTPRAVTSSTVQKTLAPRTMPLQSAPVRIAANPHSLPMRPQSNAVRQILRFMILYANCYLFFGFLTCVAILLPHWQFWVLGFSCE
jgi:hypothetical protein